MAEVLISPGVLARENDQSQITAGPVQAGAAIIGPTVKGQQNIPKLVTSYSEYLANFGSTFLSGSNQYTFFTSISAYNYFQNGGNSLLVTRVTPGSFSAATSSIIQSAEETGKVLAATNLLGSAVGGGGGDATFSGVPSFTGGTGTGLTLNAEVTTTGGVKSTVNQLLTALNAGTNPVDAVDGTYTVPLVGGTGTNLTSSITVSGQTVTGITIPSATSGSGYADSDSLTFPAGALSNGELISAQNITAQSALSGGGIGNVAGPFTFSQGTGGYTVTGGSQQTGTGATIVVTGDGAGGLTSVVVGSIGTGFVTANVLTITAADLVTAGFTGATGDLVITLGASNVELSSAGALTLAAADLFYALTTLNAATEGTGYKVNDQLVIAGGAMGTNSSVCTITLKASDIPNFEAFTLETLAHGNIMNSTGPTGANGTLESGSSDNFRWEITSPNTSSGVFSLLIRQGNDTTTSKQVVETFSNLSLDPLATNYVSKVIGDQIQTVRGSGTGVYLQSSGSYPNASRYVRVKSVNKKTPNYFDNNGTAKPEFTGSIPISSQGTFGNAIGDITGSGTPSKFYQAIDNTDSQGLVGSDYDTAINLLANRDDFRYNLITSPGLILANGTSGAGWTSIQSNCETRGDAIFVGDLVNYNSSITQITGQAASVDSSYVATYWPWLQVIDPDSRDLVWVPASTMIPGVYAYNDRAGEPWFAPAGINRGGLGAVNQAERKLTNTNRDTLYTAKVNPIASFPGQGIVVFGQKTLQTKASALDRVNVRRLLITLKNYISQIADTLVFEQNTAATRNTFLSQVNPYLESVQQRQGLYAFKVVMDNSNNTPDVIDRNELIGAVYLQPTKTAEFIYLDFNILPTGATFPA